MVPTLDPIDGIRSGLDLLAHEIVIALKKRTRFPQNQAIYRPGLVLNSPRSLLEYHLAQIERVYAELGRYHYLLQESFTDTRQVASIILRDQANNPIQPMASGMLDRVRGYYLEWIMAACPAGSDQDNYGETVTADVGVLLAVMERVNLGKHIAECKLRENRQAFHATAGIYDRIIALIAKPEREQQVVALAHNLARQYDFRHDHAEAWFRWMIDITIEIEVRYIRHRLKF